MADLLTRDPPHIMGDLLSKSLMDAYREPRNWLYIWETRACLYLIRQMDAGESVGNAWIATFLNLNRNAILAGKTNPRVSFNLRAYRESHNATPTQHETATDAENSNETDS